MGTVKVAPSRGLMRAMMPGRPGRVRQPAEARGRRWRVAAGREV